MTPIFSCLRGISGFLPASSLKASSKSAVRKEKRSWAYLPVEIREMILDVLMRDGCSLASLATVSREWQTTIKKHNFARITVTPSRLPDLNSMTSRNRALVKYIWVCLELGEYPCPEHSGPARFAFADRLDVDNAVVIAGLRDLFDALTKWEPRRGELVLDVSFYSPSDSKYWFKELTFVPDFPSAEECDRALGGAAKARLASNIKEDKQHGWTRAGAPPRVAIDTAFPRMLWWEPFGHPGEQVDWWQQQLPKAPAVTGLLLRQQNRRRIFPWTVSMMTRLLPRVSDVYFEPWREWNDNIQFFDDIVYQDALDFSRFIDPERLVLFENSDQRYLPSLPPCEPLRTADPVVAETVARASLGVRHLSAAFMVDAGDFFVSAIGHDWLYSDLTTLALTSTVLAPDAKQHDVDGVLIAAAVAARRMPRLETVEIWNGREGLAGLFRFRSARRGRTAAISWRGTWDLDLGKKVIQAWEVIAHRYRRAELVVVNEEVLDARKIRFHGDAIHHLGIEAQVVRPVSLYQMRMERDVREIA